MSRLFEFMDFRNRKLVRTVQIILAVFLIFLVVAGLLQLLPSPEYNEKAMAFLGALFATGYLVYLMDLVFVLSGLMFIFDKWSAFGAVLLAPITVNIFFFHAFLDITGWILALIVILMNVYLGMVHWPRYRTMFSK